MKTRLVPALSAEQAAGLHAAFLGDLVERLRDGDGFELRLAWALEPGEPMPASPLVATRQHGDDLGARLLAGLHEAAVEFPQVAAIGADHPTLDVTTVAAAFGALDRGADLVLQPAADGGYTMIALRREALHERLFAGIPWSGPRVLAETLERARELGLRVQLLSPAADVDTPADLERLVAELRLPAAPACPRTAALLASWGHELPAPVPAAGTLR